MFASRWPAAFGTVSQRYHSHPRFFWVFTQDAGGSKRKEKPVVIRGAAHVNVDGCVWRVGVDPAKVTLRDVRMATTLGENS